MEGNQICLYFSRLELTYDDLSFRVCVSRKYAEISIVEGAADVNAEPGTCHSLASSVKFRELRTADGDRDCPGRASGPSVVRHRASRSYSAGDADVDPVRWVRPGVRCLQPVGTAGVVGHIIS